MKRALVIRVPANAAVAKAAGVPAPPADWWEQISGAMTFGLAAHCRAGTEGHVEVVLQLSGDAPIEEIEAGDWPVPPEYENRPMVVSFPDGLAFLKSQESPSPATPEKPTKAAKKATKRSRKSAAKKTEGADG